MKNKIEKTILPVTELNCASCAAKVENHVKMLPGIVKAEVNYANGQLLLSYDPTIITLEDVKKSVQDIGYDLVLDAENAEEATFSAQKIRYKRIFHRTMWAWIFVIPIMVISMFYQNMPYSDWIMLVMTIPVLLSGKRFFTTAAKQIVHAQVGMDTLVALSVSVAFLFSLFTTIFPTFWTDRGMVAHVYYEAAGMIIAFVLLGKLLEEGAKKGTTSAIKKLMGLQAKTARVISEDGEEDIPIEKIKNRQRISVRPGERIPVDGFIVSGASYVDE
ncbi:MAG: cation transporter, partial [Flavobacteriales bacterium]|nr:cation transporter [Flavobacteriales bacterium]